MDMDMDDVGEEKLFDYRGSNSDPHGHPARNLSLYRHTDCVVSVSFTNYRSAKNCKTYTSHFKFFEYIRNMKILVKLKIWQYTED
jgi:hypothetical protein